jgi:hypothetical protein
MPRVIDVRCRVCDKLLYTADVREGTRVVIYPPKFCDDECMERYKNWMLEEGLFEGCFSYLSRERTGDDTEVVEWKIPWNEAQSKEIHEFIEKFKRGEYNV